LPALIVLAPLYGGGALFIRESVRRTGRGWCTIAILAVVYGIVEEGFTTQSLFNPNYLHLNMHLLHPAFIPAFGIGACWTIFVVTLHAAWSISTSIVLIEALSPDTTKTAWLGRTGFMVTGALFAFGLIANTLIGYRQDRFVASPLQLASSAVICAILVLLAFRIPQGSMAPTLSVPSPWVAGALSLIAGSLILIVPQNWGWPAAVILFCIDLFVVAAVLFWSRSPRWDMRHRLALGGGAALAYAWHAFIETPVIGQTGLFVRAGNVIFALGALALIASAAAKNRRIATINPHARGPAVAG
jgi:hypothetical protein